MGVAFELESRQKLEAMEETEKEGWRALKDLTVEAW